jgi:hypothetical protein
VSIIQILDEGSRALFSEYVGLETQQQISELHVVCFIMFWFNYIPRCSEVRAFPLKTISAVSEKSFDLMHPNGERYRGIDGILW